MVFIPQTTLFCKLLKRRTCCFGFSVPQRKIYSVIYKLIIINTYIFLGQMFVWSQSDMNVNSLEQASLDVFFWHITSISNDRLSFFLAQTYPYFKSKWWTQKLCELVVLLFNFFNKMTNLLRCKIIGIAAYANNVILQSRLGNNYNLFCDSSVIFAPSIVIIRRLCV